MAFDIEMIKKVYDRMPERVDKARSIVGLEKVPRVGLFAH